MDISCYNVYNISDFSVFFRDYELTRTGTSYKDRDRKILYPLMKTEFTIYCKSCRKEPDKYEFLNE